MSDPIKEIQKLLATTDVEAKRLLIKDLHEAIIASETPKETAVRLSLYPLQTAAARMAFDLSIFRTLVNEGPKTLEEIQSSTKAHPLTLRRLLRYMASVGHIHEVGLDRFEASRKSKNLADPEAEIILTHFFENCGPLFQEMPSFLRKCKYQDVTDGKATVFQPAYRTDLDTYSWFSQHPENMGALIKYMGLEQGVRGRWLDQYPFTGEAQNWSAELPLFVDVGGNVGHYCAMFKQKYPDVPGRVVLEDLPDTLKHAVLAPGIEAISHDFFEPQPVKGSKFYHLGWVLHNWNDEKCQSILSLLRDAMTAQSVLIINDMILPEKRVPSYAGALDLVMLGACGSLERTMKQWTSLLEDVGLKIKDVIVYDSQLFHGIIAATVAEPSFEMQADQKIQ